MSPEQIVAQISKERSEFQKRKYPGEKTFPDWFAEKFPIAVMECPQSAVPYHAQRIQDILSKHPKDFNIFETALCCNILLAPRPKIFGWPIDEYLIKRLEIEAIRNECNDFIQREEWRLSRREYQLSQGHNNNGIIKPFN